MDTKYLGVVTLTFIFTAIFAMGIAKLDIESIKADWPNRRCEVPSMIAASWFKPSDDPRDSNKFAMDNFSFCMSKVVDEVLKTAFAPLYGVAEQQVNAQSSVQAPLNNVRGMIRNGMDSFSSVMKEQYRRFAFLAIQASKNWKHLQFAMNRIGAIVLSIVYFGLSLSATIQNLMDFTLNAILIFIGIMVAMIILLFFVLFPVIPLIVTVIGVLVAAGIGSAASMAGAFCVDPDSYVLMANKTKKKLKNVVLGDELYADNHEFNRVDGILTADATSIDLVEIYGVKMSGSHRVFHKNAWILAQDHPDAKPIGEKVSTLICFNTTQHKAHIVSTRGYLVVSDWEEVSTEEGQEAWIQTVNRVLNGAHQTVSNFPTAPPLLGRSVKVCKEGIGWVPITEIRIGDSIKDGNVYTKVVATYEGQIPTEEPPSHEDWISDGVWVWLVRWWTTAVSGLTTSDDQTKSIFKGLHFVTESETFTILTQGKEIRVRDFTELGTSKLESTYSMLDSHLNKK